MLAGATILPSLLRGQGGPGSGRKPNIIVIVADDLTPKYLGCYGGPTPTPHLDAMAKAGVVFQQAHCVTPLCNPSRYTLLAGEFPGRNENTFSRTDKDDPYWLGQSTKLTADDPSIARRLKQAGYVTGYVGKWHSNFELGTDLQWPEDMDPDRPDHDRLLRTRHAKHVETIRQLTGFDHVGNLVVGNLGRKAKKAPKVGYHNPEWQTRGALEFIDGSARGGKPFFLHLANSIPHSPDIVETLEQDTRYTQAGKLDKPLTCHPPRRTVLERLKRAGLNTSGPLASINAGAIMLDDQLAAIKKKLLELDIARDTMILWLADHSIYGKGTVYAPGTHVPMIASWPSHLPAGKTVKTPVSLVDLFPTCLEAAGAESQPTDGVDLMPLMQGKSQTRDPIYMEVNWHRGILKGNLHYVAFRPPKSILDKMESGQIEVAADQPFRNNRNVFGDLNLPFKPGYLDADQLYDLEVDPLERDNLANDPAYATQLRQLKAELAKVLETFQRPFDLEVPAFMKTPAYAALIRKRKQVADTTYTHYPEPYDAERIYNWNLLDPLAEK
jgi:arylsulfatase A-like enzyme